MITQSELEAVLETLPRDQRVDLGVGHARQRGWFLARVVSHEPRAGRLVVTCFMDRPTDRPMRPGERVVVAATRMDDALHSAPMDVEDSSAGPEALVTLRMAGSWQPADERRHQARVPLELPAARARRWVGGAWRELSAVVVDLSSRGVGLSVDQEVQLGDRLSLVIPFGGTQPDLRTTVELRHVRPMAGLGRPGWRAGGLFRNLQPADHESVIRYIFAELRASRR